MTNNYWFAMHVYYRCEMRLNAELYVMGENGD